MKQATQVMWWLDTDWKATAATLIRLTYMF